MSETAEERKRKRLEAWRKKRQQQQPVVPKVSISLSNNKKGKKKSKVGISRERKNNHAPINPFFEDKESNDAGESVDKKPARKLLQFSLDNDTTGGEDRQQKPSKRLKSSRRWDRAPSQTKQDNLPQNGKQHDQQEVKQKAQQDPQQNQQQSVDDALDKFMEKLEAGALGSVTTQQPNDKSVLSMGGGGPIMRKPSNISGGVITSDEIDKILKNNNHNAATEEKDDTDGKLERNKATNALKSETAAEEDETAQLQFIEALKSATPFVHTIKKEGDTNNEHEDSSAIAPQLAAEVKSEKQRREQRLRDLEKEAEEARQSAQIAAAPQLGRLYNDLEGGVMEEAERNLDAAMAAPDALTVLAELNKKKELKAVDHSKVDYLPFKKNLHLVPRALADLSNDEVLNLRAKLKVRVRGHGVPAPVATFEQCGLSEKILKILEMQEIFKPFPVQAQCIPAVMAGRDVIGIAKTGSGKTLAYLLPMLRHIGVQPPLEPHESGPIGLILAPARELAYQIHLVCKTYAKQLGLRSTAVYGGAAVAEQIADLKRGTHIVVATPGRMIDILTMQSGKILSLQRVTYVVMDEADRMYDMGFAPQISAILAAVRPDRQTVLFSATFPKAVESLARKSLAFPVEVIVGGRSVASDNVTQHAELVEDEEKFLRLLQLLGEHVEGSKKVIVFVDTQVRTDNLFEQLLRTGYSSLSLHGGKEQEDRDSTISDFKRKDGPNILVATGVAGRGLDVPTCICVINYSAPNHLEAYVHQVGRTGRAGNKGVSYTFVNSSDEAKFAPIVVRALSEAGQSENISSELKQLAISYKEKVEKGEAKFAGSGFKGKGYSYDASEMNDSQKLAKLEKRQALIEAGLLDPDEEDPVLGDLSSKTKEADDGTGDVEGGAKVSNSNGGGTTESSRMETEISTGDLQTKLTPELLALPGMKDAILAASGIQKEPDRSNPSLGHPVQMGPNHFLQEFEINDYPREARWKVTQRETTSRLQDEFQTAVTLKGEYFAPNRVPSVGERKLYLHLEATSERVLQNCVLEIQRLLNEETLRVGNRGMSGGSSHKYNVLG